MVGAFLGTGFGGGVILNGELFRGHNYAAGEFGQMTIDKNGLKTAHSFRGSLESLASRTGIVRHLRKAVLEGEETMLQDELGPHLTGVRSVMRIGGAQAVAAMAALCCRHADNAREAGRCRGPKVAMALLLQQKPPWPPPPPALCACAEAAATPLQLVRKLPPALPCHHPGPQHHLPRATPS